MKYLLFTTPTGGYFPSLMGQQVQALNEVQGKLEQFAKVEGLPADVKTIVEKCNELLTAKHDELYQAESTHRAGVYQWSEAFNKDGDRAEIRHVLNLAPTELENYDVIHVNLCGADSDLVPKIKEALRASSVTVIANLDYAVETFQQGMPQPSSLFKSLALADFVFATEPAQQALINYLVHHVIDPPRLKVSVPVIPHPCDVQGIRSAFVLHDRRLDRVIVCYHRYDQHVYIPAAVTWNLRAKRVVEQADGQLRSVDIDVPRYIAGFGGGSTQMPLDLFDGWLTGGKWPFYMYELSHSTIGFDHYTIHSHDRFIEECACLELPCVANSNSYSAATLNPLTCHGPLDFGGMRRSLLRLVEDEEFYMNCAKCAYERVQQIDHRPSKTRLLLEMNRWLEMEGKKR